MDLPARAEPPSPHYRQADVTDYAETLYSLEGVDAVVHLARASPHASPNAVFRVNTISTWNVLQAAQARDPRRAAAWPPSSRNRASCA